MCVCVCVCVWDLSTMASGGDVQSSNSRSWCTIPAACAPETVSCLDLVVVHDPRRLRDRDGVLFIAFIFISDI